MQLSQILSLAALASAVSAITVSYDTGYDNDARPLTEVACSDGENGLITRKGWHTQGDIPTPYIGGAQAVEGWNSLNCGTCWRLDYKGRSINVLAIDHTDAGFNIEGWNSLKCGTCWRLDYKGRSINVLAIDHTDAGFNIAQEALDALTNGQAVQLGRIDAQATQIAANICGM
ncbi:hypothetical protein V495_05980 [Pseudogymnoascus sp. VKM F-4514 (FW-929)]|nr:hypothetical protein V495_05980 [Pseudogymnoascus sp. VKM F-4514 (FW-929)]